MTKAVYLFKDRTGAGFLHFGVNAPPLLLISSQKVSTSPPIFVISVTNNY